MSLYSDGIIFKFRFQKSRFIEEIGKVSGYFFGGVYSHSVENVAQGHSSTDTKTPCQVHLHIGVNLLAQRALGLLCHQMH